MKIRSILIIGLVGIGLLYGLLSITDSKIIRGPGFSYYLKNPSPFALVEVLSGKSNIERREIMLKAMDEAGIKYRKEDFRSNVYSGINVIADYGPEKAPMVIISAHYDRISGGPGANDNASCVAAAIAAYSMLEQSGPLTEIRARFLFSDGEEAGLQGAKGYLASHGDDNVLGVVSLELCGIGNAIGIWDVYGTAKNSGIVRALGKAGRDENVYSGIHGVVPRFSSDHRVFAGKGIPAVGVTVIPRADEKALRDYIDHPNRFKWILRALRPTIFQTYHSSKDLPETVSGKALGMMSKIIFRTLRSLDIPTESK